MLMPKTGGVRLVTELKLLADLGTDNLFNSVGPPHNPNQEFQQEQPEKILNSSAAGALTAGLRSASRLQIPLFKFVFPFRHVC